MKNNRKTKIIATLGPATNQKEMISDLIDAGVNIFRLNASHSTLDEHKRVIEIIKEVRQEKNTHTAILFDIQGPKIRVGSLVNGGPVNLVEGKEIVITSETIAGTSEKISTNYPDLAGDLKPGDFILLDDGLLRLQVVEINGKDVKTVIRVGGVLKEHKGVNMPGSTNSLSALGEKDLKDLKFAIENKIDFIGMSFVRTAKDIRTLKKHIACQVGFAQVIAKIEKPQALDNIEEIIEESDGIMVARGDLGIELAPEKVPMAQKRIIALSKKHSKFVITATQMLESMILNPIPTRAEASDVANAILDGTDAIMLSGETSVGKYPVKAVEMMASIACETEKSNGIEIRRYDPQISEEVLQDSHSLVFSAVEICREVKNSTIVVFTNSGLTARIVSCFKPDTPILAITHRNSVCRLLNAYWGVKSFVYDSVAIEVDDLSGLDTFLKNNSSLVRGDKIIIIGGIPYCASTVINFVRLHTID